MHSSSGYCTATHSPSKHYETHHNEDDDDFVATGGNHYDAAGTAAAADQQRGFLYSFKLISLN